MILTPDQRLRVFISSTLDLVEFRAAVMRSVESLNLTPVMFEAGARPHPPRALYRAYVEQSDVFVAIYSHRYGWIAPDMDISGLEDEYNLSSGMPRLVYIDSTASREPELETFLARVSDDGLSYRPFTSAIELADLVKNDLIAVLTERFHTADSPADTSGRRNVAPLPNPATAFLGRDAEVAALTTLIERPDVRLVTLTGPGGIGKTRLAVETACQLRPRFGGGTFFVSLEALREATLIGDTIAAELGVVTADPKAAARALTDFLAEGRVLLVVDNFEQVAEGAAKVAELLAACPDLMIIVTSRSPLRVRGEHEFAIEPLPVPPPSEVQHSAGASSAVALFVQAARSVRPDFEVNANTETVVAEICRRLDGLPLAIELAASMVRLFTPQLLLERLDDSLTSLGGGMRDMPARHQRLADTIAWSYELLDDAAKELFAQLSVFRGGFTVETAEQVCDVDGDILTAIASLAEQSLLRADVQVDSGVRFMMLTTIRQFAWERLQNGPRHRDVLSRHAKLFTSLATRLGGPGGRTVREQVDNELDNVRSAFEWLLDEAEPDPVADGLAQSWSFWLMRGLVKEGALWAERCLASENLSLARRGHVLVGRGDFLIWSGDYELALRAFEEAAAIARKVNDFAGAASADISLGLAHSLTGSIDEGTRFIHEAIAAFEDASDEAGAVTGLATDAWIQAMTRQFHDDEAVLRASLRRAQKVGADLDIGIIGGALAQLQMSRGDRDNAAELLTAALDHFVEAGHVASTVLTLEVVAELAVTSGKAAPSGVVLVAATTAIRTAMGTRPPPPVEKRLAALIQTGRERLGDAFDTAYESGSQMRLAEVIEYGRSVVNDIRQQRSA